MASTIRRKTPVKGHKWGKKVRTMCGFDKDTHAKISDLATDNGISFAEMVRELVAKGLGEQHASNT